jgi:tetratricopeptide (TPR) repeat protein
MRTDPAGAEAAFQKAVALDPVNATAWAGLALVLLQSPDGYAKAEASVRRALELDEDSVPAWWARCALLSRAPSRRAEAVAAWRRVVALDPDMGEAHNGLAWHLFLLDQDLSEAEHHAREAARLLPADPNPAHTLACVLARRGAWPEALAESRRHLSLGDEDYHQQTWPDTLHFFRVCVLGGRAGEAAALLREAGFAERWRPLALALRAAAAKDPGALAAVAPEVRAPAQALLDELWPPEERPAPPARGTRGRRRP